MNNILLFTVTSLKRMQKQLQVRAIHSCVCNQHRNILKENMEDLIDKKSDLALQILRSSVSKESGVISMLAAKLFLADDHKQAIFMLTNSGKHALPVSAAAFFSQKKCATVHL